MSNIQKCPWCTEVTEARMEKAKKFLAKLLDESRSRVDISTQMDLAPEFLEILGEDNCPQWVKDYAEKPYDNHLNS